MQTGAERTTLQGGFVIDHAAAEAHVMEPRHAQSVISSRGLEEGITKFPERPMPAGVTLSFNTDGFVAALNTALASNTAGYVMQIRQHGMPIASAQVGWAQEPSDGSESWAQAVRMHIASCSKLITAMAMTRTLAAHNLPASTPIIDYLPVYWAKGSNIEKNHIRSVDDPQVRFPSHRVGHILQHYEGADRSRCHERESRCVFLPEHELQPVQNFALRHERHHRGQHYIPRAI